MAKEYKTIVIVPVAVCAIFLLMQILIQRNALMTKRHDILAFNEFKSTDKSIFKVDKSTNKDLFNGENAKSDSRSEVATLATRSGVDDESKFNKDVGKGSTHNWALKYDNDAFTRDDNGDVSIDEEEKRRLKDSPYIYHVENEETRSMSPITQNGIKYISFYQPWDTSLKSFKMCRYNQCENAKSLSQADVIAFKAALIRDHPIPAFKRPNNQRWIMFSSDPASKRYCLERDDIRSKFNATCTYRLDSDIPWIFGRLKKIKPPSHDYQKIYKVKEKLAAWFVSHCYTYGKREEYVKRMQQIIDVDIYGMCSNLSCGDFNHRQDDKTACLPMLSQKYKFYLSFENTFCEDYVTEKFFKLFKTVHVIPVVRGAVDYNKLFPSDVFINTADFESPEALAKHLLHIGNDKAKYLSMLRKKSRWTFIEGGDMKHCQFCEYAHRKAPPKHYSNLNNAFNGSFPHCWEPTDLQ